MTAVGWLPAPAEELFGTDATAEEAYDVLTVDVPASAWRAALQVARDELGCTYFDWLSAVDEPGTGFRVVAHVVALAPVRRLLLRTTVPHETPVLASAVDVYAGAAWHERETHEMFGVTFEGHPALEHLLLPDGFEGHPLRKDFVLAARVAKAWPGAKEPGESDHGGPKRRQMLPPGVPDPNEWGPLKGQLPPAPARPARGAGRAAAAGAAGRGAGERPVRRARTAAQGSASQAAPGTGGEAAADAAAPETGATGPAGTGRPRRMRSASEGSASQRTADPDARRADDTGAQPADGTATGAPAPARRPPAAPRSSDAPWHHARPAFDEAEPRPEADAAPEGTRTPATGPGTPDDSDTPGKQPGPAPAAPADDGHDSPDSSDKPNSPNSPNSLNNPDDPAGGPQ
ncbi:NADH-quinone oxidoreductase subunit C [Streptomyces echinoruber]|uniref:NADH:ubiquinone oxidoreductase 30kDa subunit domain-containing protein n=1 Tax=Streptomyces echinoruber TaxID=68898 RepID=A0A918VPQ3_9ACTN|nr:NADH-quinone oxidoreductase subunit C [Streptomyces echinoruber]GHA13254.1 hypothetical protein GCM10010389_60240 [Streptomyces echinoruber]